MDLIPVEDEFAIILAKPRVALKLRRSHSLKLFLSSSAVQCVIHLFICIDVAQRDSSSPLIQVSDTS